MRFKVDENLPAEAAEALRQAGTMQSRFWNRSMVEVPTHNWQISASAKAGAW
jgi:hypothetical protein